MDTSPTVLGRFPPPLDGQAVATARLAELLADLGVRRVDVSLPEGEHAVTGAPLRPDRVRHALGLRARLRRQLDGDGPVLWTSVSPSLLGHARDRLTVLPAFGPGRPVHGVVHRGDFDALFRRKATAASAQRMVSRLASVVFLSEALSQRCAPWIPDTRRLVVPNTIGADVLPPQDQVDERIAAGPSAPLRLLFLGNFIPGKGHGVVLEALPLLRARGLGVRATFAGRWTGPEDRSAFLARADALGVRDVVEVLGGVGRQQAADLHLAADVFVLPTTYPVEAQPLVLLEALAAGTPLVSTRWASIPEMVGAPEAELVGTPPAPAALAVAVERVVGRWPVAARAARARFDEDFSPGAVRQQWLDVLGV